MQLRNITGLKAKLANIAANVAANAPTPMEAWVRGYDLGGDRAAQTAVRACTDIVVGTKPKTKVKPAPKKAASKKPAPKAAPKTKAIKAVTAHLSKEVKKAILALSTSRAQVVQATCARTLGVERSLAYAGLKLLQKLQAEVNKRKLEITFEGACALWRDAQASLRPMFKALSFAGIDLA